VSKQSGYSEPTILPTWGLIVATALKICRDYARGKRRGPLSKQEANFLACVIEDATEEDFIPRERP
jgi:hypothetical protein